MKHIVSDEPMHFGDLFNRIAHQHRLPPLGSRQRPDPHRRRVDREDGRQANLMRTPQIEVQPTESHQNELGVNHRYVFDNGYAGSVISGPLTYGGPDLWEIAVIGPNGSLVYDTPVTNDVIGWCDDTKVAEVLLQIAGLPR